MAKVNEYGLVPFGIWVRNDFGGLEVCDVSSFDHSESWREGLDLNAFDGEDEPADAKFIAEAESAVRECTEVAHRHFAAVGAVSLLPAKHHGVLRQNLALVVHKSDIERARMIAWFDCPIPPVGKLRDLVIGASDEWMSLKIETISELFAAAKEAIASSAELLAPFADRLPSTDEDIGSWAERVCIQPDRLTDICSAWEQSGRDIQLFACHSLAIRTQADEQVDWLVPGLIRRGVITLLAGPGGVGKSTAMVELMAKVGGAIGEGADFLGEQICRTNGICAYVTGEDAAGDIEQIKTALGFGSAGPAGFTIFAGDGKTLEDCLARLAPIGEMDLLIIDPLTKFVKEENEAGDAGAVYDVLNSFAQAKGCAVVVVHHLTKNFGGGMGSFRHAIRGSGVHVDRPRMVIGMIGRPNNQVEIGIVKRNIPPGNYEWAALCTGRRFDQVPGGLAAAETPQAAPGAAVEADVLDWIVSRIEKHNADGRVVCRTGTRSVYAMSDVRPVPYSRAKIDAGIVRLINAGRVAMSEDQTLVVRQIKAA